VAQDFVVFAFVGFLAQMVDGALGMAYGAVSATVLLAFGVPPAHASASVHAAEIFTTAASGASHVWHRNIDWRLVRLLAPAGIVGGIAGAYVLTGIDGDLIKPFVTGYLALIGAFIFFKSIRPFPESPLSGSLVVPLGGIGGFVDAVGGGGWGPIVTSSLMGAGAARPRFIIGSVNTVEFLVTISVSATFLTALLTGHWESAGDINEHFAAVGGLILGGVLAAPLAGMMVKKVPTRPLTAAVGILIVGLAGFQTWALLR
jgi:uncharacterized membrane protein YfcA